MGPCISDSLSDEREKRFLYSIKKYICKIKYDKNIKYGNNFEEINGFLCRIPLLNETKFSTVLITNNYIIENIVEKDKELNFNLNYNTYKIIIDDSRKKYINNTYKIAIIEIKKSDNIESFLDINDPNSMKDSNKNNLYIIQYLQKYNDIPLKVEVTMVNKKNNIFYYFYKNKINDFGGIIFNNSKVLGIHKEYNQIENKNIGYFIKPIIEDFYEINYNNNNEKNFNESIQNEENKVPQIIQFNVENKSINNNEKEKEEKKEKEDKEDKEINLIFNIIGKDLFLDVKESLIFSEVIRQLNEKYLWLANMDIIGYQFNGINIAKDKTVKENGLIDSSNIIIIEKMNIKQSK